MAVEKKDKPEQPAAPAPSSSGSDEKLFGAAGYIICILVPLLVLFTEKKENKFLVFHAWQSLAISIVAIAVWIVAIVFLTVVSVITGGVGSLISCVVVPVLLLAYAVVVVFLAYKAYLGEKYKLPIIGEFAEKHANK